MCVGKIVSHVVIALTCAPLMSQMRTARVARLAAAGPKALRTAARAGLYRLP